MPYLSGIMIYPVKSLDGMSLSEAALVPSGALMHDRRWRLIDAEGAVVNGKKTAQFHGIRAAFEIDGVEVCGGVSQGTGSFVTLSVDEQVAGGRISSLTKERFPLLPGSEGPCGWLSEALAIDVFLQERFDSGFPDDRDAPGPTLISYESLLEVARWFGWTIQESRRRFRMNLEFVASESEASSGEVVSYQQSISQGAAFWEDILVSPRYSCFNKGFNEQIEAVDSFIEDPLVDPLVFRIGHNRFRSVGVCRRCVVPSRDSSTGSPTYQFRDSFEARRRRSILKHVDTNRWSDFFRLGVNTAIVGEADRVLLGEVLRVET